MTVIGRLKIRNVANDGWDYVAPDIPGAQGATGVTGGNGATGVAGATGAAGSTAFVQLYDTTLVSPSVTIDITSISAAYTTLYLMLMANFDDAVTFENPGMRFNNDSGGNYTWNQQYTQGTSVGGEAGSGDTSFTVGVFSGTSKPANDISMTEIWIPNYAGTTFNKLYRGLSWTNSNDNVDGRNFGGSWHSTAAINRITLISRGSGSFITGSRATLYGIL